MVESDVRGAMGADLLPFEERETAESFAAGHSGRVIVAEELTREFVESLRTTASNE